MPLKLATHIALSSQLVQIFKVEKENILYLTYLSRLMCGRVPRHWLIYTFKILDSAIFFLMQCQHLSLLILCSLPIHWNMMPPTQWPDQRKAKISPTSSCSPTSPEYITRKTQDENSVEAFFGGVSRPMMIL